MCNYGKFDLLVSGSRSLVGAHDLRHVAPSSMYPGTVATVLLFWDRSSPINVCMFISRSIWIRNGLVIMLVTKRSAGVKPEVNVRNTSHECHKACK